MKAQNFDLKIYHYQNLFLRAALFADKMYDVLSEHKKALKKPKFNSKFINELSLSSIKIVEKIVRLF